MLFLLPQREVSLTTLCLFPPSVFHLSRSRRTFLLEPQLGHSTAQPLSRRSLTAEVRFRSQINLCDTYSGQWH